MLFEHAESLVGNTPLVRLKKTEAACGIRAELYAKMECYNPLGSVKDRLAFALIEDAEKNGLLNPGSGQLVIEATSGNTGIGLAFMAARRGYQLILTMPASMSEERKKLLAYLGAGVVLTDPDRGMAGAVEAAGEIARETGGLIAGQFTSPANPAFHYRTTGPEIWRDLEGRVDVFVAGAGTGGTFTGVSRFLKEKNAGVKTVVVEPAESAVISGKPKGKHGIQGIGPGFIPDTLDVSLADEVITVTTEEAVETSRFIARTEGLLVGISSGAALAAAIKLLDSSERKNLRCAVVFPDTGERYLSTSLFNADYLKDNIVDYPEWRRLL